MLEQPAILEAVADAPLERLELGAERHDAAAADLVAVALDDPLRRLRVLGADGDAAFPGLIVQRERKRRPRVVAEESRRDIVRLEQAADDARLDLRRGAEDDDQIARPHTASLSAAANASS